MKKYKIIEFLLLNLFLFESCHSLPFRETMKFSAVNSKVRYHLEKDDNKLKTRLKSRTKSRSKIGLAGLSSSNKQINVLNQVSYKISQRLPRKDYAIIYEPHLRLRRNVKKTDCLRIIPKRCRNAKSDICKSLRKAVYECRRLIPHDLSEFKASPSQLKVIQQQRQPQVRPVYHKKVNLKEAIENSNNLNAISNLEFKIDPLVAVPVKYLSIKVNYDFIVFGSILLIILIVLFIFILSLCKCINTSRNDKFYYKRYCKM
jgi:hypothetical protein